ncbi:MAG: major capsid protein [Mycobacterium sp.]
MIIDDFLEPAQLTGFVREVPGPAQLTLNRFLPDRNIGDIEAALDSVTRTNRAAKFRAYDAETPIGRRDQFESKRVKLPPLGQKLPIGEYERLTLERIRTGGDNRAGIVDAIYDDAETNTRAVYNRMEIARGDVLDDGKFTLAGENGLKLEADFGLPSSHIVTASTPWDDSANASPLTDLRAWIATYVADTGERPAYMVVSEAIYSSLLLSAEVRQLSASLAGTPSLVTDQQLGQVMGAFRLPQIIPYDTLLDVDGTTKRVLNDKKAIFLPSDPTSLGFTAWGITAEALELAGGQNPSLEFNQLPGLVGVVIKEGDPVRIWTKVGAVGMPIITDPRRLMVATVLS